MMNTAQVDPLDHLQHLVDTAAKHLRGDLDNEQLELYDIAFCQAELDACRSLTKFVRDTDQQHQLIADYFAAETRSNVITRLGRYPQAFGLHAKDIPLLSDIGEHLYPANARALGEHFLVHGIPEPALAPEHLIMRDTFSSFATQVVAPLAEQIHRQNLIVPDAILSPLREMGCFGLSVPERFGGLKPDDHEDSIGMVVVTEELSRGSLGAAGSLITRPEIMARAIIEGGTEAQKQRWLPGLAAGKPLCAIAVTEPSVGSDVANVALSAKRTEGGWHLNGSKTWCTFAGKAGVLLVLARTNPNASVRHKGLSLFIVEKPSSDGHEFVHKQPGDGQLSGKAIATLGYRGMHSYDLFFDNYFVPAENLIGAEEGIDRGFYFTMRGFMGGRLQTAARACGLMRAAFEAAAQYASDRHVFGQPVASYPLSQAKFAKMGALITACKILTLDVARLMDKGEGAMQASLVKLLACRAAEWVTREALQLHGGMGYAEESAVSRYFADARVLSIFEGAEETLAIRVVGKALVAAQK